MYLPPSCPDVTVGAPTEASGLILQYITTTFLLVSDHSPLVHGDHALADGIDDIGVMRRKNNRRAELVDLHQ